MYVSRYISMNIYIYIYIYVIVLSDCLDLYHHAPDSSERQCKSRA